MVDILRARKVAGATFEEILDLLLDGRLERVSRTEKASGFRSLTVDPAKIRMALASRPANVVAAERAIFPFTFRPLAKLELLVASGLVSLAANETLPPSRGTKLMTWSVELFKERYWTLITVARQLCTDWNVLRREFDDLGILPVISSSNSREAFYDIEEVKRHENGALLR
ncbi:hypothetical protein ACXHXM_33105